jgi:transglutaminase-like putative cysteine protease
VSRAGTAAWAAAALLAVAAPAAAGELGPYFLAGLEVEAEPGLSLDGPVEVTLELHPAGVTVAGSLREWFPRAAVRGGAVRVRLDAARARAAPTAAQRRPSFFVDADQPPVPALRAELERAAGPSPSVEDLTAFVDGWIVKKGWGRLLDTASTVATRREGDCTEHAVLLAALARLEGRPSRVVLGVALVEVDGKVLALGHAWAELHEGGRWIAADAAARSLGVPVHRLPLGFLADEGPGYEGAALRILSPGNVRRIRLARPRP